MADPNDALANALIALTNVLQQQQAPTAATTNPVLNPFESEDPFDLATRAGSTAYATACEALSAKWDGKAETLPTFIVALKLKAREVGWNMTGDTGSLSINSKNLLDDYQELTSTQIEAARTARTNDRAKQNARAMYHCLKRSIMGDLQTVLFQQVNNIPSEDGPELFLKITEYSVSSSIVLSMNAVQQLLNFDPSEHKFNIADINCKLLNLFVLARTSAHELSEPEKLQYTLTVYDKINQPESWAVWVRNQTEKIEDGILTECQTFMNQAVLKQQKIRRVEGSFQGSLNTLQQDVVAMVAAANKGKKKGYKPNKDNSPDQDPLADQSPAELPNQPPFVRHFKSSNDDNGVKYKVGDSKTWKGNTYYFCDCPNHRNKVKWHPHEASACKLRLKWLEKKKSDNTQSGGENRSEPAANVAEDDAPNENSVQDDEHSGEHPPSVLLASVMSSLSGNSAAKAFIAEAINSLE